MVTNRKQRTLAIAGSLAIILGISGSAFAGDEKDVVPERLSEFTQTGETRSCINLRRIRSISALDDYHLLVRVSSREYYLNRVENRCNGASRSFNRLEYRVSNAQLCRLQIIRVVDNTSGFTIGSCGLSDFERLEPVQEENDGEAS